MSGWLVRSLVFDGLTFKQLGALHRAARELGCRPSQLRWTFDPEFPESRAIQLSGRDRHGRLRSWSVHEDGRRTPV